MSNAAVSATAESIMTKDPIVLETSMSILECVAVFTKHKISSAPVNIPIGDECAMLTELVLVRALVLSQLQPDKFNKLAHCQDLFETAAFVEPKDSLTVVVKAMIKSASRRVLVKSAGKKIYGIISPKDLLRTLTTVSSDDKAVEDLMKKATGG